MLRTIKFGIAIFLSSITLAHAQPPSQQPSSNAQIKSLNELPDALPEVEATPRKAAVKKRYQVDSMLEEFSLPKQKLTTFTIASNVDMLKN